MAALERKGLEFQINEGDGAFYGPKIDFHIEDCLQRSWQLGTIQLDFSMPERFELVYTDKDTPVTARASEVEKTLEEFLSLGFDTILLWGAEYWQFRKSKYSDDF